MLHLVTHQPALAVPPGDAWLGSRCSPARSGFWRVGAFTSPRAVTTSSTRTHLCDPPLLRAPAIGEEQESLREGRQHAGLF